MGKPWTEEMSQGWLQGWVEAGLDVSCSRECAPPPTQPPLRSLGTGAAVGRLPTPPLFPVAGRVVAEALGSPLGAWASA